MKAFLVDDEPRARFVLRQLIEKAGHQIEVCGECGNLTDAVPLIKEKKPDVVFLDVQMPQYAGYEIVEFFDTIDFEIIFVTAYDQYAIRAFEINAMDYLVKPIERERFQVTLEKLLERTQMKKRTEEYQILLDSMLKKKSDKLIIPEIGDRRIVELSAIIAIEANGSYTNFYLKDSERFVVSKNLKYFEDRLKQDGRFFRSHRTYIINTDYIISINKKDLTVTLAGDVVTKIARVRLSEFEKTMV